MKIYINSIIRILALTLYIITLVNCSSQDDKEAQNSEPELESSDLEEKELDEAEKQHLAAQHKAYRPFPENSSYIKIKKLILVNETPDEADLNSCKKSLEESSEAIDNIKAFSDQTKSMLFIVDREPALFHWCFFTSLADLEYKLENYELANTYDGTEYEYNQRMKGLWVLSVALDIVNNTDDYYDLLKDIYIRQSDYYFNRQLENYAEPLYANEKYKLRKERAAAHHDSGITKTHIKEDSDIEHAVQ